MTYNIVEVARGETETNHIISNNTYMSLAGSTKVNTKSWHAKCKCCSAVEWEMHLYEDV